MYLNKAAIRDLARLTTPRVDAVQFHLDSLTLHFRPFNTEVDIRKGDIDELVCDFTDGFITTGFEHLEALHYEDTFGGEYEPSMELSELLTFITSTAITQAKYAEAEQRAIKIQHRRAA